MRYIDKERNASVGDRFSRDFVMKSFDEQSKSFIPSVNSEDSFDSFRYETGDDFKNLLINEQKGCCCYCMKRLDDMPSDIEHIIPKKCSKSDFDDYVKQAPVLAHHVAFSLEFAKKKFITKAKIRNETKLPHIISYFNLAASCKNEPHCNGARGYKKILPLPLMKDVNQTVFYAYSGDITTVNDSEEYEETFNTLKLNCETLREIRMLWHKVVNKGLNIESVFAITAPKQRMDFILNLFDKSRFIELRDPWIKYIQLEDDESVYWNSFLRYDWFFNYYSHHDRNGNNVL